MASIDVRPFLDWARRLQKRCGGQPAAFRDHLQGLFEPMIRSILRTGLGQPVLIDWVQEHLPLFDARTGLSSDPTRCARSMAGVLSESLMAYLDPLPGRETVIGP
jgi:hypothetical protein